MKRDLARLYVDMTLAEFERAVDAGHLPGPVMGDRYSRAEIDAYINRLVGGEAPDWRSKCKLYNKDQTQETGFSFKPGDAE